MDERWRENKVSPQTKVPLWTKSLLWSVLLRPVTQPHHHTATTKKAHLQLWFLIFFFFFCHLMTTCVSLTCSVGYSEEGKSSLWNNMALYQWVFSFCTSYLYPNILWFSLAPNCFFGVRRLRLKDVVRKHFNGLQHHWCAGLSHLPTRQHWENQAPQIFHPSCKSQDATVNCAENVMGSVIWGW